MATLKLKKYTCARDWISDKYPDLFTRPMAIRINKELEKKKPNSVTTKSISNLLIKVSKSKAYQHVIINNDSRYHLDGSIMGNVPAKHKDYAREKLKK